MANFKNSFSSKGSSSEHITKSDLNFLVDTAHIHNAGGSLVQELTYGLHLYYQLLNHGISSDKIVIRVACDSELFLGVAKLKSFRFLLEKISNQFQQESLFEIVGSCSLREQTLYDPYNNMLRNTASLMAQFMGGANVITCRPYDYLFSKMTFESPSEFGHRYALQSLYMLRDESHINKVIDPLKGSHTIEALLNEIKNKVWDSVLNWEERGFLENIKDFSIISCLLFNYLM